METGANQACLDLSAALDDQGVQDKLEATLYYQRWSIFDGTGAHLPVGLRGFIEGVTPPGELVTSNEWSETIHFARSAQGSSACTDF